MNKVLLVGRLTKDVELKGYGDKGGQMASFTLAVNDMKETDFVPCVAFGKTAEIVNQYTTKGSMIAVEGKYKTRKVNDNYYTNVNVSNVELLGSKNDNQGSEQGSNQGSSKPYTPPVTEEANFDDVEKVNFDNNEPPF